MRKKEERKREEGKSDGEEEEGWKIDGMKSQINLFGHHILSCHRNFLSFFLFLPYFSLSLSLSPLCLSFSHTLFIENRKRKGGERKRKRKNHSVSYMQSFLSLFTFIYTPFFLFSPSLSLLVLTFRTFFDRKSKRKESV